MMRNYPQEQLTINAARRILAGTKFTETMAIFREVGIFITDFDDTLSEGDTISTILDTAAECAQTTKGQKGFEQSKALASQLAQNYMDEYKNFMDTHLPTEAASSFNSNLIQEFLTRLSEFDRRMVTVIENSGVLEGIQETAFKHPRRNVPLKAGAKFVLGKLGDCGIACHVVSVNWSRDLISTALHPLPNKKVLTVHSNDLEFKNQLSTGKVLRSIVCADDKADTVRNLIENSAGVSVMCGDSLSDLGALLIADLGIVIGENSTLKKFLALAAVPLAPLSEAILSLRPEKQTLFQANSWEQIEDFLFNITQGETS